MKKKTFSLELKNLLKKYPDVKFMGFFADGDAVAEVIHGYSKVTVIGLLQVWGTGLVNETIIAKNQNR